MRPFLSSLILVSALVVSAMGVAPAEAQRRNPLIEQGQSQYDELRYEEALQTLSAALVRSGNSNHDLATIYQHLSLTYLALGRQEEAAGAYRSLLAIDPEHSPGDDVSPRFRTFFEGVHQQWDNDGRPGMPAPAPVTIRHRSPPESEPDTEIPLDCEVEDPGGRVAQIVLAYRQGSDDVFRRVDTALADGRYRAVIPAEAVAPPLVEYYFEGLDSTGLPVVARGDVAAPLRVAVPEPSRSILTRWWFWVGAVAILGGIAAAVGVAASQSGGAAPAQGTFVITVR
ncbi:MAG: hypothetical protein DRJ42_25350 [Deltaproteobacteria bacterium]|nr:MAG: hypothetical protein DRJ42_25350 [Deltaproteobacteria bacterium]